MTTIETTAADLKREQPVRGWVFYDGECPLCLNTAARFAALLGRHGLQLATLQTPWVQRRLGLKPGEPLAEMKLLTIDGRVFGGADALLQIARQIWWAWLLFALMQIPGAKPMLRLVYRKVAANRQCLGGRCNIKSRGRHHGVTTFFKMP
jgi:predicted DCC family thiol-disulfide oxidoreductase YuxK